MHRLFVALDLPAPVTDEIAAICHGLNGMRWVSPDNLHLTLRFIGEVPPSVTLEVEEALAEIDAAAFSFALVGIGHFESAGRPRAVWLGVEADPGLAELRKKIDRRLRAVGVKLDHHDFRPHVALGRTRGVPGADLAYYMADHGLFRSPPIMASEFHLFRSHLSSDGAHYTCQTSYGLSGGWSEHFDEGRENGFGLNT